METQATSYTGRVKWFNNKTGFGFITVTDGERSGSDIFVHHSGLALDEKQYKYLVQGEYVEFTLASVEDSKYDVQARQVTGIKGGKLMCETHAEQRDSRKSYQGDGEDDQQVAPPAQRRSGPGRGQGRGEGRGQGRGQGRVSKD